MGEMGYKHKTRWTYNQDFQFIVETVILKFNIYNQTWTKVYIGRVGFIYKSPITIIGY